MSDNNEKELTTWGFTKGMRTGLITFLLGSMMAAIVFLFVDGKKSDRQSEKDKIAIQKELYEKMIQMMDKKMEQPVKAINDVVKKVDTAAGKAIAASITVDSLSTQYIKNKKR